MNTKHYFRLLIGSAAAFLLCFFITTGKVAAQEHEKETEREHETDAAEDREITWPHKLTLGVGGGVNGNFANGAATTGYVIDQNMYTHASGIGPEIHALLEIPLSNHVMIVPRISYSNISFLYTDGAAIGGAALLPNFATAIHNLGVELLGKFAINRFHFLLGPSLSAMLKKTYSHGTHSDAEASSAELPGGHSGFAAIGGGIGYDAPINTKNTMWLTPEIFYSYPITNLGTAGGNDLHVSTLRGALSLKFDISPEELPPPAPPQARPLSVTVTARGVLPNGQASNEPVLPEKSTSTRASEPVLPYVFFDENSSVIPARYSQSGATGFSETQLAGKDALEVNHELLDIVGSRMKQYPEISVKITGTNSNTGSERHNLALSKERAMAVRNYLINTWGISENRITVDARNLPELATNPVTPAGIEENRRAEIVDSKTDDPVQITDRKSDFDGETLIRYQTSVINPDNVPVSSWRITLDQNGNQIGNAESGSGTPPAVIPSKIPNADRYVGQTVHYTLEVTDVNGKNYTADGMTHVVKSNTKDEQHLEKYAMLSFDFDSSLVNKHAEKMLSLITESINRDARSVKINGYCDITGTDEYNQALSERRANSAAEELRTSASMPADVSVTGHGRQDPRFSNDLPEGRQLNRRVEVEIAKSK